ncbi:Ubiquitin ligase-binding protein BUL2 [Candida viswanathii]|uniref:Ubiquitin ligase-binding protein BUL2 n=1 Tax=Candida viswanathii TaxID=5486 RepID=A0A367YEK0_9ASCO|nr:Ubiquitin ligase-binding protein BUL2 [Candida viswanathii]
MSSSESQPSVEDTIGTILPSYGMFTSTVGMNVTVPETTSEEPPTYAPVQSLPPPTIPATTTTTLDSASIATTSHVSSAFNDSVASSRTSVTGGSGSGSVFEASGIDENGSFIIADENTGSWRETILDNVHKLPNLTFESHKISQAVDLEVHFTKEVCEPGKKPTLIQPEIYEYKQGDLLNGYILIRNTSDKPIPYEMFYVLFEGNFMIANPADVLDRVPVKIRKFLEMFDFGASWRLVYDDELPGSCEKPIDPIDGTQLCFGVKKVILPGVTYKRLFTFRIPNNLLDSECNDHGLSKHVEMPPTLGLSRWEVAHYPERAQSKIKDFSMMNTSVSYGVMARFIGRKSTWEADFGKINTTADETRIVNSKGDEYIILKELTNHFRVVQNNTPATDSERLMKLLENKLMYNNLILRIKEKIDHGNQLIESIEKGNFSGSIDIGKQLTETEIELAKCSQLYRPDHLRDAKFNPDKKEYYETFLPLLKKSITRTKNLGTLRLATPKQEYCVSYIPPVRFRTGPIDDLAKSWKFEIPLELSIKFPSISTKSPQLPTIKSIRAELASLTIKSEKYAIPIEFNHDLIFNKQNTGEFLDRDLFFNNVTKPFRKYSTELYNIVQKLGSGNFRMERRLVDDLKAVCNLDDRCMNMIVQDFNVNGQPFKKDAIKWDVTQEGATASVKLGVNLESLLLKGEENVKKGSRSYDRFTLVPDFQSCFMGRMYHIRLTVHLSNGSFSNIKVPVRIQKVV